MSENTVQANPRDEVKEKIAKREAAKQGRIVAFLKEGHANFLKACDTVKIKPTKRQASKWLNHKGAAWRFGR